jgi:hypothetical protein
MRNSMIKGQLEIDHDRGVIYFHSLTGQTELRICRLPYPIPKDKLLDITHMYGCSWNAGEKLRRK